MIKRLTILLLSVLGLIQCVQAYVIHLVQQVEVDGAIVETIDQMVETGDGYTTSNATDRAGYIFAHWSTSTVQEKAVAVTRTPRAEPISLAETPKFLNHGESRLSGSFALRTGRWGAALCSPLKRQPNTQPNRGRYAILGNMKKELSSLLSLVCLFSLGVAGMACGGACLCTSWSGDSYFYGQC